MSSSTPLEVMAAGFRRRGRKVGFRAPRWCCHDRIVGRIASPSGAKRFLFCKNSQPPRIASTSARTARTKGKMATSNHKQTLVESGTELSGTLKSDCSVVVNGAFEGEIEAPELSVSGTGAVSGRIRVEMLVSEGTLSGVIEADQVQLSGTVRSDTRIKASDLEVRLVQDDGKLEVDFGDCTLDVGDDPRDRRLTPAGTGTAVEAQGPAGSTADAAGNTQRQAQDGQASTSPAVSG